MPSEKIKDLIEKTNLVDLLKDTELSKISDDVMDRYSIDQKSQSDWEAQAKNAIHLASLKSEPKNYPFANASNITYPIIATATTQFAARTMPELQRGDQVVKVKVNGYDATGELTNRARNVGYFMSYQLLMENNDWLNSTDKLLHLYSNIGTAYKKIYYDPIKRRYVYHLCRHDEVIVNTDIQNLESAPAITHIYNMSYNDIISHVRAGVFSDVDLSEKDEGTVLRDSADKELHEILEQHCLLDLDDDGYSEPYIVTIHKKTMKVLRIVARYLESDIHYNSKNEIIFIKPITLFIDYHFMPSMDGSFHSLGFGTLLAPINHAVNTICNQLIDAGKLANMQCGFLSKSLRLKPGQLSLQPGELKVLDNIPGISLRDNMEMLSFKEPSRTLFELLGLLIESAKDVASVSDILQGDALPQNSSPTTVLTLVEQGLKLHSSILKRLYSSLKREFELIYKLNSVFVDPNQYATVLNLNPQEVAAQDGTVLDFSREDLDITPVADPNLSSDAKRSAQNQFLMQFMGHPAVDDRAIIASALQSMEIPNFEQYLPDKSGQPDPAQIQQAAEIEEMKTKLGLKQQQIMNDATIAEAQAMQLKTQAIKNIAEAEAAEAGSQLEQYKAQFELIKAGMDVKKVETELAIKVVDQEQKAEDRNIKAKEAAKPKPKA